MPAIQEGKLSVDKSLHLHASCHECPSSVSSSPYLSSRVGITATHHVSVMIVAVPSSLCCISELHFSRWPIFVNIQCFVMHLPYFAFFLFACSVTRVRTSAVIGNRRNTRKFAQSGSKHTKREGRCRFHSSIHFACLHDNGHPLRSFRKVFAGFPSICSILLDISLLTLRHSMYLRESPTS